MRDRDNFLYEETDSNHTGEIINRVNLHVDNMLKRGELSENYYIYLTSDNDRTQQFYLLPKVCKDTINPSRRPIVSGSVGPPEKNSQLVDPFIGEIVPLSQSYIRAQPT